MSKQINFTKRSTRAYITVFLLLQRLYNHYHKDKFITEHIFFWIKFTRFKLPLKMHSIWKFKVSNIRR